jgi:16S rRNA C967 or C1407 C5-methylase (RsmB/RsmF family)
VENHNQTIEETATQADILDRCKVVKSGGEMVYATCSFYQPNEQVQALQAKSGAAFEFVEDKTLLPIQTVLTGSTWLVSAKNKQATR